MPRTIRCEGAPRDLGLDQGRAYAAALRAEFEGQPAATRWRQRLGARTPATVALARDLVRHFPQQSETLEGIVSGARVPFAWLAERLADSLLGGATADAAVAAAGGAAHGALIARSLDCEPCVRHSRPEGGFASLELTLPWYASAFAGVNAGGLAVAGVRLPGTPRRDSCAVPAVAMVQDCLARFDSVRGAVDWCSGRPGGGRAALVMADRSGTVAGVEIDGEGRREIAPKDGWIEVDARTAGSALRGRSPEPPAATAARLGSLAATIDPMRGRIEIHDADAGRSEVFEIDAAD